MTSGERVLMWCGLFAVALLFAIVGSCAFGWRGFTASDGYRDGVLQKMTHKGIIWSTWEGEIALSGFTKNLEVDGNTFAFTVWDEDLARQMRELPVGSIVRLHYRQHRWVPRPQADTAYAVWKFDVVRVDPRSVVPAATTPER